jgi:hypothetical protein
MRSILVLTLMKTGHMTLGKSVTLFKTSFPGLLVHLFFHSFFLEISPTDLICIRPCAGHWEPESESESKHRKSCQTLSTIRERCQKCFQNCTKIGPLPYCPVLIWNGASLPGMEGNLAISSKMTMCTLDLVISLLGSFPKIQLAN